MASSLLQLISMKENYPIGWLFPATLLQLEDNEDNESTTISLTCTGHGDSSATADLEDKRSGAKVEMELRFGEDGLISSVYGMRLFLDEDMVVVKAWEIRILWIANSDPMIQSTISELDTQFEQRDTYLTTKASHDGVLVPTAIEVGWWEEDSLELCFKRTNTKSDFSILYPRWRIH
jgi:hypothetical protein